MKYALVDCRISKQCLSGLREFADELILLPPHTALDAPVASHPDMLIWTYGNKIITYKDYGEIAKPQLDKLRAAGFEVLLASEQAEGHYPRDVYLNCALVGKHIICRARSTSQSIKTLAERQGLTLVNTNQGYAKCSCAVVSERALITADCSIYGSALSAGLDALLVREGGVHLEGYPHGFIGGATGLADDALLFCGNLDTHPDADRIREFCRKHGKRALSLSDEPLEDLGTVFVLKNPK